MRANSIDRGGGEEIEEDEEEADEEEDEWEDEESTVAGSPNASHRQGAISPFLLSRSPDGSAVDLDEVSDAGPMQLGRTKHHCTDLACIVVLILALAGLGMVTHYGHRHGDIGRLFHGLNFKGDLCGIDVPEPYLYWCLTRGDGLLDLGHPICVSSCPSGNSTLTQCFNGTSTSFVLIRDYPSYPFAGRLCMPVDSWLTSQVKQTPLAHDILYLSQIARAWQPLLVSAGLALLLGYAYLLFLNVAVGQLIWLCMTILVAVFVTGGGYLVSKSVHGGLDGKSGTGDAQWDLLFGVVCILLGVSSLVTACCRKTSLNMAIGCIEAACECIFDLPSLLLEPLVTLSLKAVTLCPMLAGFVWLLSCGKVINHGLYRSLEYTHKEKVFIVYYIFMMIWINELWSALSHFAIAYVTQRWYFTPYGHKSCTGRSKWGLPTFAILRGFSIGLFFHLGTLAFGAVVIAFARVLRIGIGYLEKLASDTGNCVGACIARVLFCCLWCFESCLEFMNKNAYIDVALHSSNFCAAAQRASTVVVHEMASLGALMGACWTVQLGGLGAITGLGALLTGLMVSHMEAYSQPTSEYYVQDPILLTIVAAVISFLVALAFMMGFDTVSCTILYCFAVEKNQARDVTGKAPQTTVIDARGKPRTRSLLQMASVEDQGGDDLPNGVKRHYIPSTLKHLLHEPKI
jgi:hypothetical protein